VLVEGEARFSELGDIDGLNVGEDCPACFSSPACNCLTAGSLAKPVADIQPAFAASQNHAGITIDVFAGNDHIYSAQSLTTKGGIWGTNQLCSGSVGWAGVMDDPPYVDPVLGPVNYQATVDLAVQNPATYRAGDGGASNDVMPEVRSGILAILPQPRQMVMVDGTKATSAGYENIICTGTPGLRCTATLTATLTSIAYPATNPPNAAGLSATGIVSGRLILASGQVAPMVGASCANGLDPSGKPLPWTGSKVVTTTPSSGLWTETYTIPDSGRIVIASMEVDLSETGGGWMSAESVVTVKDLTW